jgi:hypothetical protein
MTYTQRLFLFLILPLLSWTACDKNIFKPRAEDHVLPPITMTGEGTFGCKINGEVFLPTPKPFDSHLSVEYHAASNTFYVNARESVDNSYNRTFNLYVNEVVGQGIYLFDNVKYRDHSEPCIPTRGLDKDDLFLEDVNQIEILYFDAEERIISGTFQFTLINEECQDTIRITEGRFDLPWLK